MSLHVTFPKPAKGSGWLKRKDDRRAVVAHERTEKDAVRRRDHFQCRWPACEFASQKPRLEVAHLDGKKIGGDHGLRSSRRNLILLCWLDHQGASSLHSGHKRIEPLTARGTEGPCAFYQKDLETGRWLHVASERAIGVSETRGA